MNVKHSVAAIILAAGSGERMRSGTPKQFLLLDEKPMVLYAVDAFQALADRIVVVTSDDAADRMRAVLSDAGLAGSVTVAIGGKTRAESAYLGIKTLETLQKTDLVLIHDAARCLVDETVIRNVIRDVLTYGSGVACIPAKNTIKTADAEGFIDSTVPRAMCREIQTPQGFRFDAIRNAYEKAASDGFPETLTDDAMILETYGGERIRLSEGSEENFKVTTPFDFTLAETVLTIRRLKAEAERTAEP